MPATLAAVLSLALAASQPSADPDSICGWNLDQLREGAPATITALLARGDAAPPPALAHFGAWVHGCDAAEGRKAVLALRAVLDRRRGDPVLNALLGVLLARGPEVQVPGATGTLLRAAHHFSNAEKEAARRLLAGAKEQGWPEPAVELAELGFATRRRQTLDAAAQALESILRTRDDAQLRALLADVHIARRDYGRARSAAEAAVRGGAPAGARALGIALMRSGKVNEGGERYLAGLETADSLAFARYYEDIDLLLVPEERAAWDGTPPAGRGAWLRQGWEWRAVTATVSPAERLSEHFARVEYALQHHTRTSFRGARPFAALWLMQDIGDHPLDDMGIIYVRHGPPDFSARATLGSGQYLRMLWLYRRVEGGQAAFEFDKDSNGFSRGDYYLMDPLAVDCHAGNDPTTFTGFGRFARGVATRSTYANLPEWFHGSPTTASVVPPCYGTFAGDSGKEEIWSGRQLRQRTAHVVLRTETANPVLRKPLTVLLNTYAFRAPGGTELVAYAAIPAAGITPDTTAPLSSYALRLFASVEDPVKRTAVRADTLLRLGPRARFGDADVLRTAMRITAPPLASATVRLRVSNAADSLQGQIVSTARAIPDLGGRAAALSDLVVAEVRDGGWRRGSAALSPVPAHALAAGQPFRAFLEGYNFERGEPLEIEILVAPGSREGILGMLQSLISKRNAMSLRFREAASPESDSVLRVLKEVGGELEPGVYTLELTVRRLNTGETLTASTLLTITKQD